MDLHYGPLPGYVPYDGSLGLKHVPPSVPQNPPHQLPANERADVISKTYEDLIRRMKHAQNSKRHDRFITEEDLDAVYKDPDRIPALIQPDCRNVQLERVRTEMRLIISILVLISARECLANFQRCLYRRMTPDLTDKDLPITMSSALWFLPLEQRDSFMDQQYAVLAMKLKEPEEPTTLHCGAKYRLPFEQVEEKIGVGGYGKVDKVWIPPGYLEDKNGRPHTVVACKRFKVENEFAKEAENIKLLKSRLTTHTNVMLHLITIAREQERFILLPFAARLDLGIFLRAGFDEVNKRVYDFQHTFPHVCKPDGPLARQVTMNILQQAYGVASALEWLHHDVSGAGNTDRLYCTHMDLKPANILIDNPVSENSTVGIWKISDFGISVFREDSQQQDSNVLSPLDYVKLLTSKTRPKRVPGSYTAPEVNGDAATVGRGSDVWSFACLFSEVVLFALDRDTLVQQFRDVRATQMKNDYFYMPLTGQHLAAPGQEGQYRLKDKMVDWLYDLPNRYPAHSGWLSCYTMTILEMLVVDPNERPLSKQLAKMVRHLRGHFEAASAGRAIACRPLSPPASARKPDPSPMPADRTSQINPVRQTVSSHSDDSQYQSHAASSSATQQPPIPSSGRGPSIRRVTTRSEQTIHQPSIRAQTPVTSPVSPMDPFQSPTSGDYRSRTNSTRSSRPSLSTVISPLAGPGIMISNPNGRKTPNFGYIPLSSGSTGNKPVPLDKLGTPADISFSPDGELLAYLIKSNVYIFKFNSRWDSTSELAPIYLPLDVQWKHVAIAGDFIAVGGRTTSGQKQVIFMRLSVRNLIYGPPHQEISTLSSIRVTASGAVALMCQHCIVYTSIDLYASYGNQIALKMDEPRSYGSIAFNGTGSLLHAWIFGRERDELHTWHIQEGSTDLRTPLKQSFTRSEGGVGSPRLFPYTDYPGVVIEAPATKFFTSSNVTSNRKDATKVIGHVCAAKVFRDFSFITVEADSMFSHGRLKEYPINHHSGRSLGDRPQELAKLQHIKPIGEGPLAMFITSYRSTDTVSKIVVVVASGKGKIETLHFEMPQLG